MKMGGRRPKECERTGGEGMEQRRGEWDICPTSVLPVPTCSSYLIAFNWYSFYDSKENHMLQPVLAYILIIT